MQKNAQFLQNHVVIASFIPHSLLRLQSKGDPGLTPGTDELDCQIPGSPEITTISAAMTDKVHTETRVCVCVCVTPKHFFLYNQS